MPDTHTTRCGPQVRVTSVADVAALGKQPVVMRSRDVTRSLEPSFFVPGVLKSFKDNRVLAEVGRAGGSGGGAEGRGGEGRSRP